MRLHIAITLALTVPSVALADGAFPNSAQVFAPEEEPLRLWQASNFGLIHTDDGAQTWPWICEEAIGALVNQYQLGPAPDRILFALSNDGLSRSEDDGCHWSLIISTTTLIARDVFPDYTDPLHVLLIARPVSTGTIASSDILLESTDGGRTFPTTLYRGDVPSTILQSVEIARSDPSIIYLTMSKPGQRIIGRSPDHGRTFDLYDQTAIAGDSVPKIAAVDPHDAQLIYLRAVRSSTATGDRLLITRDGGQHLEIAHSFIGSMATILLRNDGKVMVSDTATTFITEDGVHFDTWPKDNLFPPHPRWLTERGNTIYISGDNFADGFAIGSTSDDGKTFQPVFHFPDLDGPIQCENVTTICGGAPWDREKMRFGIDQPPDMPKPPADDGCSCTTTLAPSLEGGCATFALLFALFALRRARKRG